ncbi:MAG: 1-pyrroline-5-carboxylate dehydrogenase [Flavobacteriaceae bacterium]|nr:1-pyrroline-5-carboxylate dehydrogenase [Flavobacteriaceae bacterium]
MNWARRASIFLKAADLIAGPFRSKINAATMIAQSKTVHQAEIDAACEYIDFLRFNAYYMQEIYQNQPESSPGMWNQLHYRPLEGFVYSVSPFNFTAISGNLSASAALMGNVVVWKPSDHQIFSAQVVMEVFEEAGLPDGVINMVMGDPEMITNTVLASKDFAGIHYTGSTFVFQNIWKKIGNNISNYKTYPKIVGETGGKDFIIAHQSAKVNEVATAIVRGAFEYQGQKCSAASRVYLPESLSKDVLSEVKRQLKTIKMGPPSNLNNYITAVIHEEAFDRIVDSIEKVRSDNDAEIFYGGTYDKSVGYFISPTVVTTTNPDYFSMKNELFGPLVTVYTYPDEEWEKTLNLVDRTSIYALTGAVFSEDRYAIDNAIIALENCAGNFYLNDKPTGAVVGQQPFGGGRASGTNDKAGSMFNLLRWVSPRMIKENFVPVTDYRYPFLG